ncbi:ATP-binding protein [Streptomyces sp. NPDC051567]|uniref:ATP-binding protein n=1 Tax=Streptomyces sp. NPDC051567 TaxID=3365660 RepID=UPI00378F2653
MPPARRKPSGSPSTDLPSQLTLTDAPESAQLARTYVRDFVTHHIPDVPKERMYDIQLVVSELVTNAYRYGTEPGDFVRVVLDAGPGRVRVEVHDPSRRRPRLKAGSEERQRGRGLLIVEALAHTWGVDELPMGKSVWAELHWAAAG